MIHKDVSPAVAVGCIIALVLGVIVAYGVAVFVVVKIIKAALA